MAAPALTFDKASAFTSASTTCLERCAAGIALVLMAPVLAVVLGAVRLFSGRAPLVAHRRVGQFGEPLWVLKIRTMWDGTQERSGGWVVERLRDPHVPAAKAGRDPRVSSSFASFCRRHSIDELPQLLHVASGKMRWVGPRPMTQAELDEHYAGVKTELLSVPPGLTGLWQVKGRNRLNYAQRRRLDLLLVRRFGWKLCAHVLVRTIREILLPRYAW